MIKILYLTENDLLSMKGKEKISISSFNFKIIHEIEKAAIVVFCKGGKQYLMKSRYSEDALIDLYMLTKINFKDIEKI